MSTIPSTSRLRTGIDGLDTMLNGGFMRNDAVMVAGSAGTGKTTLALQYLVSGANNYGEGGIYISFEQLPDQLYRDARNFGWNLRKMEEENKLRIICTSPTIFVEEGAAVALLEEPIRAIGAKRIVVDSLSHLSMFVRAEEMRMQLYRTVMLFKAKSLSSLLIWEAAQKSGESFTISDLGTSFLVDAIVMLKFVEIDSTIRNVLVVMKMRGSPHDKRLREYRITPNGIMIEASFTDYAGLMSGAPTRTASEKFAAMFSGAAKKVG